MKEEEKKTALFAPQVGLRLRGKGGGEGVSRGVCFSVCVCVQSPAVEC